MDNRTIRLSDAIKVVQDNLAFSVKADIIKALSALPAVEGWLPIESAPVDKNILACVKVINNKTGDEWWDMHTILIDSETGEIQADNDAGWAVEDYSHWQPLPAPPEIE